MTFCSSVRGLVELTRFDVDAGGQQLRLVHVGGGRILALQLPEADQRLVRSPLPSASTICLYLPLPPPSRAHPRAPGHQRQPPTPAAPTAMPARIQRAHSRAPAP